ncbi:MAG: NRDE family protein [Polaribacter sp.]
MCTVTYFPLKNNGFILTSNRDETPLRKTISPKTYLENEVALTYPKDALAGGTWIGLSDKKRLVCLLNGGFTKHQRKTSYKISRGIIVKELLSTEDAIGYINTFNFTEIEPFTIILVDWNTNFTTYELVWDGNKSHFQKLLQEPKIWSSATLYTLEMKNLRKRWFQNWIAKNKDFTQAEILAFHQNEKLGNKEISPKMKRLHVETVSTTSVQKTTDKLELRYIDFLTGKTEQKSFNL